MLLAEIHGHVLEAALGNEDYLTSAVFGHLRYVPPLLFWEDFLARTKGFPLDDPLSFAVASQGVRVSDYSSLRIDFWPSHPEFGEPDLVLCFSGAHLRPLVIVIEVKLWSLKSDRGERDQLADYVKILSDLRQLKTSEPLPERPLTALVYLTPRESIDEIQQTLTQLGVQPADFLGVFRVQWQDLLAAIEHSGPSADGPPKRVLQEVQEFLRRRGLEYFHGFTEWPGLSISGLNECRFYRPGAFARHLPFEVFEIRRGDWTR